MPCLVWQVPLEAAAFERQRDKLQRLLGNLEARQPSQLAAYRRSLALESPRFSNEQLLAATSALTFADLERFQPGGNAFGSAPPATCRVSPPDLPWSASVACVTTFSEDWVPRIRTDDPCPCSKLAAPEGYCRGLGSAPKKSWHES